MIGAQNVTEEMVTAMYELEYAAINYRKLYEKANTQESIIYVNNATTGDAFMITKGRYVPCITKAVFDKDIEDLL